MAISTYVMKLLAPRLKGAEVLSLSYPDLLLSGAMVEELFSFKPTKFRPIEKSGRHGVDFALPDTIELMHKVANRFHCIDVAKFEGPEQVVDLNYPQDFDAYDVVIDPGTLEHCFNIGQAMINAASAVRVGGIICHMSPISMVNHGFWNFCPTVFKDFYEQNGFDVEHIEFFKTTPTGSMVAPAKGREDVRYKVEPENGMICIAKRVAYHPIRFPVQSKYAKMFPEQFKVAA